MLTLMALYCVLFVAPIGAISAARTHKRALTGKRESALALADSSALASAQRNASAQIRAQYAARGFTPWQAHCAAARHCAEIARLWNS